MIVHFGVNNDFLTKIFGKINWVLCFVYFDGIRFYVSKYLYLISEEILKKILQIFSLSACFSSTSQRVKHIPNNWSEEIVFKA